MKPKSAKIVVYSAEWCPWCHKVMDFLKENKIEFEEKNVDEADNAKELEEVSGQTGIPVTIVDKEIIIGFDVPALKRALKLK